MLINQRRPKIVWLIDRPPSQCAAGGGPCKRQHGQRGHSCAQKLIPMPAHLCARSLSCAKTRSRSTSRCPTHRWSSIDLTPGRRTSMAFNTQALAEHCTCLRQFRGDRLGRVSFAFHRDSQDHRRLGSSGLSQRLDQFSRSRSTLVSRRSLSWVDSVETLYRMENAP